MQILQESLLYTFYAIILVFVQALSAIALGRLVSNSGKAADSFSLSGPHEAIHFTLGSGILSLVYLLLALSSLFHAPLIILINAVLIGFFVRDIFRATAGEKPESNVKSLILPLFSNVDFKIILVAAALLFILGLPRTLIQPLVGDCLVYYYAQAKLIAYTHSYQSIRSFEHMGNSIPFVFEMIFSSFYLIGGGVAGQYASKFFCFISFFFALVLFYHTVLSAGLSRLYAAFSVLILVTSQAIIISLSSGKPDIPALLATIGAIYVALNLQRDHIDVRSVATLAFLTALACLGKLSFLSQITIIIASIYCIKRYTLLHHIKEEVLVGISVFAVTLFLGWSLKNIFHGGEPLAPFVHFFSRAPFSTIRQVWNTPETTRHIIMTYPLALIFGNYYMQEGTMSSLLCICYLFFGTSLFSRAKNIYSKEILALLAGALLSLGLWLITNPSVFTPRYIYPIIISFIIVLGPAFDFVTLRGSFPFSRISMLIYAVSLTFLTFFGLRSYNTDYLIKNPNHYSTPYGFTQAAYIVNSDPRNTVKVRFLTSFFEPFDGRVLSSFEVLQLDKRLMPSYEPDQIKKFPASEFWINVKNNKIDYIFTWHHYFIYPKAKHLFDLSYLPPGMSVKVMEWEDSSLLVITRNKE